VGKSSSNGEVSTGKALGIFKGGWRVLKGRIYKRGGPQLTGGLNGGVPTSLPPKKGGQPEKECQHKEGRGVAHNAMMSKGYNIGRPQKKT